MKIVVTGTRTYKDVSTIYPILSTIVQHSDILLQGGAQGVDRVAKQWAKTHAVACQEFPAAWERWGKSAGARRNGQMARQADALIAIWDGRSRGTAHMIQSMRALGKPVHVFIV